MRKVYVTVFETQVDYVAYVCSPRNWAQQNRAVMKGMRAVLGYEVYAVWPRDLSSARAWEYIRLEVADWVRDGKRSVEELRKAVAAREKDG